MRTFTLFLRKILYAALFVSLFSATGACHAERVNAKNLTEWLQKCLAPTKPAWDNSTRASGTWEVKDKQESTKISVEKMRNFFNESETISKIGNLERAIEELFYDKNGLGLVKHRSFRQGLPMTGDPSFRINAIDEERRDKALKVFIGKDELTQDELTRDDITSAININKAVKSLRGEAKPLRGNDDVNAEESVVFMANRDPSKKTKTFAEKKNLLANKRIDYAQLMSGDIQYLAGMLPGLNLGLKREIIKLLYRRICEDPQALKREFYQAGDVPRGHLTTLSNDPAKPPEKVGARDKPVYGEPVFNYAKPTLNRDGTREEDKTSTTRGKKRVYLKNQDPERTSGNFPRHSQAAPVRPSAPSVSMIKVNLSDVDPRQAETLPTTPHARAAHRSIDQSRTGRGGASSPSTRSYHLDASAFPEVGLPDPETASVRSTISDAPSPKATSEYRSLRRSNATGPLSASTSVSSGSSNEHPTSPRIDIGGTRWAASLRTTITSRSKASPAKSLVNRSKAGPKYMRPTTSSQNRNTK